MKKRLAMLVIGVWMASGACSKRPALDARPAGQPNVAVAERLIDAFYSFDRSRLAEALSSAPASAPGLLFYQGWAEGGNYRVRHRAPCRLETADMVRCAITVEDDLIKALRLDLHVTDTFHITVADGRIRQVTTSSNDPPKFHEALAWVRRERAALVSAPCEGFFAGGPTPGKCVRAMVQGFAEFAARKRLLPQHRR